MDPRPCRERRTSVAEHGDQRPRPREQSLLDEDAPNWIQRGREAWAREEPVWGKGNRESELHLLPDLAGLDAIELGCGTAYVSAWLIRRGARVVGLDISSNQLSTARMLQEEFGLRFPLVHADAERAPFADESFDFAISQYGAAIWCDPYRWIPEASRILRRGGRLVFETGSPLVMCCYPTDDDEAPADSRLHRDYFGMHRFEWRGPSGAVEDIEFRIGHGDMVATPTFERLRDRGPHRDPGTQRRRRPTGSAIHPSGVGEAMA